MNKRKQKTKIFYKSVRKDRKYKITKKNRINSKNGDKIENKFETDRK